MELHLYQAKKIYLKLMSTFGFQQEGFNLYVLFLHLNGSLVSTVTFGLCGKIVLTFKDNPPVSEDQDLQLLHSIIVTICSFGDWNVEFLPRSRSYILKCKMWKEPASINNELLFSSDDESDDEV